MRRQTSFNCSICGVTLCSPVFVKYTNVLRECFHRYSENTLVGPDFSIKSANDTNLFNSEGKFEPNPVVKLTKCAKYDHRLKNTEIQIFWFICMEIENCKIQIRWVLWNFDPFLVFPVILFFNQPVKYLTEKCTRSECMYVSLIYIYI